MVTAANPTVEFLTIENDMVRVEERRLVREVRLQDLLPHIENRPPVTLGLLPKSAIFAHWDESNPKKKIAQFIAERTAGMSTCVYLGRRYNLSIPWTYFLFDFETSGDPMEGRNWQRMNTRLYWAKQQVTNINDELVTALVPNVDTRGQICWGSTGIDGTLPLGINIDRTVEEFYRTEFTHSNGAGSPWQSKTGHDDWTEWEKQSKLNPAAFLDFPEWDPKAGEKIGMKVTSVKKVLGTLGDRAAPIEVTGRIPEMPDVMTFGRAEEWLKKLTKMERRQIAEGIKNIGLDDPLAIATAPKADALGGEAVV
jgi:hypothetical protein